ncbi:hypothetical protein [Halobellus rufus]|uniref:hypothetical protein n=1 Tax=Halobellus rufus TaxID=1448860 RepID=UPI000679DC59|nr:hypothetical protein [Halobellus rufus]
MVVVSAAAFLAGAFCLFYGARALRTKRAVRRLERSEAPAETVGWPEEPTDAAEWRDEPGDGDGGGAADRGDDVDFERGVVLIALGLLCLLFGVLSL